MPSFWAGCLLPTHWAGRPHTPLDNLSSSPGGRRAPAATAEGTAVVTLARFGRTFRAARRRRRARRSNRTQHTSSLGRRLVVAAPIGQAALSERTGQPAAPARRASQPRLRLRPIDPGAGRQASQSEAGRGQAFFGDEPQHVGHGPAHEGLKRARSQTRSPRHARACVTARGEERRAPPGGAIVPRAALPVHGHSPNFGLGVRQL
jgi:hypothetical protein